jgi:VanZ family protein
LSKKIEMGMTAVPNGFQHARRFLSTWGPVGIYSLVIFAFSSRSDLAVPAFFPVMDKFIHTAEYAVLGGLWVRAMSQSWRALPTSRVLVSAVLFVALHGISDEWHQAYVPGRSPEIADVLADTAGGVLGSLGFLWFRHRYHKTPIAPIE